jgi:hypothetical protein
MTLFKALKLWLRPPKLIDPDFGPMTFMYLEQHPERSYWEAEWLFPLTSNRVAIALAGDESGPLRLAREWYLELPSRFPGILELARPQLARVFRSWRAQELPADIFTAVALSGFGVEDLSVSPLRWDVSFETINGKWLGIIIPFVDDEPQEPIVDT